MTSRQRNVGPRSYVVAVALAIIAVLGVTIRADAHGEPQPPDDHAAFRRPRARQRERRGHHGAQFPPRVRYAAAVTQALMRHAKRFLDALPGSMAGTIREMPGKSVQLAQHSSGVAGAAALTYLGSAARSNQMDARHPRVWSPSAERTDRAEPVRPVTGAAFVWKRRWSCSS